MRHWVPILIVFSLLALNACGERRAPGAKAGEAPPSPQASFGGGEPALDLDPCRNNAAGAAANLICGEGAFAKPMQAITATLEAEAKGLSPAGVRALAQTQRAWVAALPGACGLTGRAPPGGVPSCMKEALAERAKQAANNVETFGGLTFQRLQTTNALPISPAKVAELGFGPEAPHAMVQAIRFPRIDNPKNDPAIERFNKLALDAAQMELSDVSEAEVEYTIELASQDLVSIEYSFYEYTLGAAHPNTDMRGLNVLMQTGAPISPADVFRPGSGWETGVTRLALADLAKQFSEREAPPPEESEVRDAATRTHRWVITPKALRVLFPPYAVGPYALGGFSVDIPWSALKPYLNPQAPAPIGNGQS